MKIDKDLLLMDIQQCRLHLNQNKKSKLLIYIASNTPNGSQMHHSNFSLKIIIYKKTKGFKRILK